MLKKLLIILLLLSAFVLRLEYLGKDLPYFYNEDEAHHFNRVVNMLKTGNLDPQYFHKPSLHFYLRMPVTALAFFYEVSQGRAKKIEDIKTEDKFGLAGYAFSVSHPSLVKANRLLSIILLVAGIALVIAACSNFGLNFYYKFLTGALLSFSPALMESSAIVGVDSAVFFFVCLCLFFCSQNFSKFTKKTLIFASIAAGLAISSKYNAAPIVLLPLILCFLQAFSWQKFFLVLLCATLSFFAASPFILLNIPLFLNQFAFEIWHYKISGHVGHLTEPGSAHLELIFSWIKDLALGKAAIILCCIAVITLIVRNFRLAVLILIFPACYLLQMSAQKAFFERNYLVLIPFFAILFSFGLKEILLLINHQALKRTIAMVLIVPSLLLIFLNNRFETFCENSNLETETRELAYDWLQQNSSNKKIALDGNLQMKSFVVFIDGEEKLSLPDITRIDLNEIDLQALIEQGYSRIVTEQKNALNLLNQHPEKLNKTMVFRGLGKVQRIPKNPDVYILDIKTKITSP